ncbi:hypothetical protein PN462_10835, partial [Spirulina sp. CS-785/01]
SMCSLRGCESQPHRSRSVSAGEAVSTHPLSSPTCSEVGESRGSFVEISTKAPVGRVIENLIIILECGSVEDIKGQIYYLPW